MALKRGDGRFFALAEIKHPFLDKPFHPHLEAAEAVAHLKARHLEITGMLQGSDSFGPGQIGGDTGVFFVSVSISRIMQEEGLSAFMRGRRSSA